MNGTPQTEITLVIVQRPQRGDGLYEHSSQFHVAQSAESSRSGLFTHSEAFVQPRALSSSSALAAPEGKVEGSQTWKECFPQLQILSGPATKNRKPQESELFTLKRRTLRQGTGEMSSGSLRPILAVLGIKPRSSHPPTKLRAGVSF